MLRAVPCCASRMELSHNAVVAARVRWLMLCCGTVRCWNRNSALLPVCMKLKGCVVPPDNRLVPRSDTASPDRDRRRPIILVIDDELAILDLLQELLQDEGYRVLRAENGLKGIEQTLDAQPDLILTDLMMPVMDGRALSRHLRAEPRTAQIPLILISAAYRAHDDDLFDAVLAKPFDIAELLELIHAQLGETQ